MADHTATKAPSLLGAAFDKASLADLLEQYRLFVELTERLADRRQAAHSFFFSLSAGLFAAIAFLYSKDTDENLRSLTWIIAAIGVPTAFFWHRVTESYRSLARAKFGVIQEMEAFLPFTAYSTEWRLLTQDGRHSSYSPITRLEIWIPRFFALAFLALALWAFPWASMTRSPPATARPTAADGLSPATSTPRISMRPFQGRMDLPV